MVRRVVAQVQSDQLVLDRRGQIIKAAISVFHSKGFHVATTADIAKEAGLTQSNLYNYVRSKQDVLLLVCHHLVGTYEKLISDVAAANDDPLACLVESVDAIIEAMSEHREEVQLLYHETHALEKPDRKAVLAAISAFIGSFESLIRKYEKAYSPIDVSNKRLAANFLSFVPAMIALRSWDLAGSSNRQLKPAIRNFILAGLGISAPAPRATNATARE